MKNKKIIIFLTIVNIILIVIICSLLSKSANVIKKETITIKEMSETEYDNSITELNKSHEDYSTYIQTCKTLIAKTLTKEGITTSNQETLETMANNISKIFTERTKLDTTIAATENDIIEGKQAYVNGKLVTGTIAQKSDLEEKYFINEVYRTGYSGVQSFSQTIDCTSLLNYKDLTEDNFIILNNGNKESGAYNDLFNAYTSSEYAYSVQYVSKSYNSDTGILTINMRSLYLYRFCFLIIIKIV